LAELDICPLLKLCHSQFLPLTGNYPSQQWISSEYTACMHTTTSCWDERRTDIAPSPGSTYPLQCITTPLCSQSTKLLTVLHISKSSENLPEIVRLVMQKWHRLFLSSWSSHNQTNGMVDRPVAHTHYNFSPIIPP
jgi:hypothetical protein